MKQSTKETIVVLILVIICCMGGKAQEGGKLDTTANEVHYSFKIAPLEKGQDSVTVKVNLYRDGIGHKSYYLAIVKGKLSKRYVWRRNENVSSYPIQLQDLISKQ